METILQKRIFLDLGIDSEGHILLAIKAARHSKRDRDVNELVHVFLHFLERCFDRMDRGVEAHGAGNDLLGQPTSFGFTIIYDRSNFTRDCFDYELLRELIGIMQDHYPEMLHKVGVLTFFF